MRFKKEDSLAVAIDIQEKLVPVINGGDSIVADSARFIKSLKLLEVPIISARQYPKGLGNTIEPIKSALGEHTPYDKTAFSVCGDETLFNAIKQSGKKNILIFGIEAHICVLQSVIDLLEQGYNVILVCDCIGSRFQYDTKIAIRRAAAEGAVVTTSEAIIFEFMQKAGGDIFKQISALIK